MLDLNNLRNQITNIDQEIAHLFEKRMNLVKEVSLYKIENKIDTEDKKREAQMLSLYNDFITDTELVPYYHELIQCYIYLSKKYQNSIKQSQ